MWSLGKEMHIKGELQSLKEYVELKPARDQEDQAAVKLGEGGAGGHPFTGPCDSRRSAQPYLTDDNVHTATPTYCSMVSTETHHSALSVPVAFSAH